MDVERAILEETPVAAMAGDSVTTAFVEESAVTALDVEERWPRLPQRIGGKTEAVGQGASPLGCEDLPTSSHSRL